MVVDKWKLIDKIASMKTNRSAVVTKALQEVIQLIHKEFESQEVGIENELKIVRVDSVQEARREAELYGLTRNWKYIANSEQIKGIEFRNGITYFIHHNVPQFEIDLRIR